MIRLNLEIRCVDGSWSATPDEEGMPLVAFLTKYGPGMWTAEREAVAVLELGQSYEGGGGATPEWKVTRVE